MEEERNGVQVPLAEVLLSCTLAFLEEPEGWLPRRRFSGVLHRADWLVLNFFSASFYPPSPLAQAAILQPTSTLMVLQTSKFKVLAISQSMR